MQKRRCDKREKYIGDAISRGAAGIIITDEVWDSEDVYDADSMSGSLGYYPDDFFVVVMHDKKYSIGRLCNNFGDILPGSSQS